MSRYLSKRNKSIYLHKDLNLSIHTTFCCRLDSGPHPHPLKMSMSESLEPVNITVSI